MEDLISSANYINKDFLYDLLIYYKHTNMQLFYWRTN